MLCNRRRRFLGEFAVGIEVKIKFLDRGISYFSPFCEWLTDPGRFLSGKLDCPIDRKNVRSKRNI
jgi:hypothetical protein